MPGYYYRLDDNGDIYTNTCCPDTASEHRMFFKLMLDTLKIWAKDYHVDGFRFDLMSFSFKDNLLDIQKALHEIDPTIYLYGEGWNFGEVGNDALGINATQENMAGTGIGTFSDRGRDAIRGGSFFDSQRSLVANQGFINDKITKTISLPDYAGIPLELHPILRNSVADFVVKQSQYNAPTGTFTIPPRTTTVFLER